MLIVASRRTNDMNVDLEARIAIAAITGLLTACSGASSDSLFLNEVPIADTYCLDAQRIVTKTTVPVDLVVHNDYTAFVKSKAIIDGPAGRPEIQQFNWYNDAGDVLGFSCKLKNADHLNLVYGENSAGPDGLCQEMNQAVFELVAKTAADPVFSRVIFDPSETVSNAANPGMTGPDWLAEYTMDYQVGGQLHVKTKGFIVEFTDERYAKAPERFRGVHYCHLIAPDHLTALLEGRAEPGTRIGQSVPADFPNSGPGPEALSQ
jgi:hypothetical protein